MEFAMDDGHVVAAFGEIFGDRLVDRSAAADDARRILRWTTRSTSASKSDRAAGLRAADDARRILRHDHENRHRAASAQAR